MASSPRGFFRARLSWIGSDDFATFVDDLGEDEVPPPASGVEWFNPLARKNQRQDPGGST